MLPRLRRTILGLTLGLFSMTSAQGQSIESHLVDGLAGTLVCPRQCAHGPVVLILVGSGPSDRDGNSAAGLNTHMYRLLAEALATRGFVSFRYDKRGVSESRALVTSEATVTIADFADDAVRVVHWLESRFVSRPIVIAGHSEGAMLAVMAAAKVKVAGLILISGAGRTFADVVEDQLLRTPRPPDVTAEIKRIFVAYRRGTEIGPIKPPLDQTNLFRPSVQAFLKSVMNIDPQALLASRNEPILIVGGGQDIQVLKVDFERLAAARQSGITRLWIDDMTHVMKPALPGDASPLAVYQDPSRALSEPFVEGLATWLMTIPCH